MTVITGHYGIPMEKLEFGLFFKTEPEDKLKGLGGHSKRKGPYCKETLHTKKMK